MTYGGTLFAAYFAQHAEQGYVKDGLELWLDGIDNTRNGHSANPTAWEDLSGHNRDFDIVGGTIYDDHIYFDGTLSSCAKRDNANIDFPSSLAPNGWTVELGIRRTTNNPGNYKVSLSFAPNNFCVGNYGLNYSILFYNEANKKKSTCFEAVLYLDTRCQLAIEYLPSETRVWNNAEPLGNIAVGNGELTCNGNTFWVGTRQSGAGCPCEIYSLRVYSRQLTAEEVAHNYAVDKARFNLT